MTEKILICTDLDRTLIPNGTQPESPTARAHLSMLAAHPQSSLAYVSGRHRALVEKAITNYRLPVPDYVIGDVGTTVYQLNGDHSDDHNWHKMKQWDEDYACDWNELSHAELKATLSDIPDLRIQGWTRQNRFKLSYIVPLFANHAELARVILQRLSAQGAHCNLIWSTDEPEGVGLLDILPQRASKLHAIENVMQHAGFDYHNTVFCGDSGNDMQVLVSPIPAVLVANAEPGVRERALALATESGNANSLYLAKGGFYGMNGNYAGGVLEGIANYHPDSVEWMSLTSSGACVE